MEKYIEILDSLMKAKKEKKKKEPTIKEKEAFRSVFSASQTLCAELLWTSITSSSGNQ